jgi:hypothetical protein
LDFFATE